jgi:hypothetical protein
MKPHGSNLQVFRFEVQGKSPLAISDADLVFVMDFHWSRMNRLIDNTTEWLSEASFQNIHTIA